MLSIFKALGKGGGKGTAATLPPLVLSWSLCNALEILSQIFGQTWHQPVVGELLRTLRSPAPPSGQPLALILTKLIEEASISRPGLSSRFVVSRNQIVYRSADRRYMVLIVQTEGEEDAVRVVWQAAHRQLGTSHISYRVQGRQWTPVDWKVAEPCLANLDQLAKVGGEVLGFLEEYKLLPPNSPFQRALDAQVSHTAVLREAVVGKSE